MGSSPVAQPQPDLVAAAEFEHFAEQFFLALLTSADQGDSVVDPVLVAGNDGLDLQRLSDDRGDGPDPASALEIL